ncbi:MAG: M48 family metalloprotease [Gemmatimonadales bacterium]
MGRVAGRRLTAPRTTFFEEQARHRRRSLRFLIFGLLAVTLTGIPVSLIVTPVLFLIVLTALHLVNLAAPIPPAVWDAIRDAARLLPDLLDPLDRGLNQGDWSGLDWLGFGRLGLALVLPGMAFMLFLWLWVRALFRRAGAGGVLLSIGARPPRERYPEERQLVNIVEEMGIAAGLPPPAVMLLDRPEPNAAVVGTDPRRATFVVTTGLLERLDRDETQGVLAHLTASACNGDLRIAMLLLSVTQTFALLTATLSAGTARSARRILFGAMRGVFAPDEYAARKLADLLTQDAEIEDQKSRQGCLTLAKAPFVLAAATTNFLAAMAQMLFFGPFLAAMWRARRYLADASAVRLTRNPHGLANALQRLQPLELTFAAGHSSGLLFLHWAGETGAPAGGWHPSLARRVGRLVAQGARLRPVATGQAPARANPILRALVGLLMVLVWALFGVGIAVMVVAAVLVMSVTLAFQAVALFAIHGFFTALPDILHWLRYDAVPLFERMVGFVRQLLG